MKHIYLKPENKKGFAVVIAIVIVVILIIVCLIAAAAFIGDRQGANANGEMITNNSTNGNNGQTTKCANISFGSNYYPWIKDASAKYLNGDDAALITMINAESTWNPNASNQGHATGLGQFMPRTARGYPEFVGGNDKHGITWPAGNVYDISTGHTDDARFDAKRSIYAAAHLLGGQIDRFGSLKEAYEQGYHTYCKENTAKCQQQKSEAQTASAKIIDNYNILKSGGKCIDSSSNIANSTSNGACLPVAFIHENHGGFCGRASQAQVVNYFNPNQYPSPTSSAFQEKNGLSAKTVHDKSGKPYIGTGQSANIEAAINSIQKGFPVIVYTDLEGGQHIFVLTGYDSATQTFRANDTNSGIRDNFQTTCTSILGGPRGVLLTKANLLAHLVPQANYFILVQ
ncbi:MAG: transglycosylase SLT domain-containing protein [Candidatus Berkelbacteria bacterium]